MAVTVQEILAQARRVFTGTSDQFLFGHLQRVHAYLCGEFSISSSTTDIELSANDGRYSLDPTITLITNAEYYQSSASHTQLRPFRPQEWDETKPGWRRESASTPSFYAVEGHEIILYPVPATGATGGYPKISLDHWNAPALTINGTIPDSGRTFHAYLYGLLASVAPVEFAVSMGVESRKRGSMAELIPMYQTMYEKALEELDRYYTRRNQGAPVVIYSR